MRLSRVAIAIDGIELYGRGGGKRNPPAQRVGGVRELAPPTPPYALGLSDRHGHFQLFKRSNSAACFGLLEVMRATCASDFVCPDYPEPVRELITRAANALFTSRPKLPLDEGVELARRQVLVTRARAVDLMGG
jgi:hypothetical protein